MRKTNSLGDLGYGPRGVPLEFPEDPAIRIVNHLLHLGFRSIEYA
jgi:hypothetical protein